ncbi:MAG: hypothetical protein K2N10_01650, partial [Muribaculaceae bacterium]|nr:hypothetical protein [Muribaculaceae bacterium]
WNTEALKVSEIFPEVAAQWNDYVGKGAGYVFGVALSEGSEGAVMYFDNIHYSNIDESWVAPEIPEIVPPTTVPAIEQPEENVLSVYSAYGELPFNTGWWGQSTVYENVTIDGKQVAKLTSFNYLGWEFVNHFSAEGYDYLHVDFYPCEETGFGFTPISVGPKEKGWIAPEVKVGEWNGYDVPLSYFEGVNFADIFQFKFDQGSKVECYIANVYFYKSEGGDEPEPEPVVPGATYSDKLTGSYTQNMGEEKEYPYTLNYSITYNEDKTLTINGAFNWTNGEPVGMIPGSVYVDNVNNELTLENGVRTATTVDTYEARAVVPVRFFIPVALGVFEVNLPDYVVGSEKNGGDDPEPEPEPEPEPVAGATYSGVITGSDSVEVEGVTTEYPYTCNYSIVYNEDKTLTIKATIDWANGEVPGLIAGSVFINNVLNDFTMTDGVRTVTTTDTYNPGEHLNLNFYMPRMLGVLQFPVEYVVGADNTTGIADVKAPALKAGYYDLRGARVDNPAGGLFIRVENGKATKVYLK